MEIGFAMNPGQAIFKWVNDCDVNHIYIYTYYIINISLLLECNINFSETLYENGNGQKLSFKCEGTGKPTG